ncbi:related to NADH-ubiquinone oxidoreductase 21.3 kda subunit [Sporisorium scitamineum]|uniref:Related to NADH-ubiquinone oxidoreductase 21.3 kDa subunit n=1 Tax=Sporisorium scitamineum TaxID=49012 RepID=A0A127ZI51_9BASI|nr:related to NADH-ubiquinone oxidoreductase 21.3 kda subunit [Sporisorium scitamineum]
MSLRATRTLFNEAKNYASPHSFTYVEGKTPFWRKFRQIFSANPEISSGIPSVESNRWPQPGSRPERSATPPSAASDPAGNLYHNRDFRRKYPKLEMITQKDLTTLLLSSPNEDGTRSLQAPEDASNTTALTRPADLESPTAFTDVLAQVDKSSDASSAGFYSTSNLPPRPPFKQPHHILKLQKGAVPHDPHAYYPAENYA